MSCWRRRTPGGAGSIDEHSGAVSVEHDTYSPPHAGGNVVLRVMCLAYSSRSGSSVTRPGSEPRCHGDRYRPTSRWRLPFSDCAEGSTLRSALAQQTDRIRPPGRVEPNHRSRGTLRGSARMPGGRSLCSSPHSQGWWYAPHNSSLKHRGWCCLESSSKRWTLGPRRTAPAFDQATC